jgi:UDP-N-acetylmuramate: L-alanyl-gamma-D-glutamyl-meso-diaminopimelate ligase
MTFFSVQNITSLNEISKNGKVHLVGVCGVAMGQLALALSELGYRVSGSDKEFYDPMGSLLSASNVDVRTGYSQSNITKDLDLVIIGNAVSADNVEAIITQKLGIRYACLPSCVANLLVNDRKPIVVAGTHGKSTTSALLTHMLLELQAKPGFMVGASLEGISKSFEVGSGKWTVLEGDEYDSAFFAKIPKFLFYNPKILIITSIEFDHADIYPDLESIISVFNDLVCGMEKGSTIIVNGDDETILSLLELWREKSRATIVTYGLGSINDWICSEIIMSGSGVEFLLESIKNNITTPQVVQVPLLGVHNALNTTAVLIALHTAGFTINQTEPLLNSFKGVKRRLRKIFDKKGIIIYEDFAHHPTAVKTTLSAVHTAYPEKRLWAIFDPRSNTSRRKVFQNEYCNALSQAETVVIKNVVIRHNDSLSDLLDTNQLASALEAKGKYAVSLEQTSEIVDYVKEHAMAGDIIVLMSNGSFDGLSELLLGSLG